MDLETAQTTTTTKFPIIKQGEYDMWRLRIEQYFQEQDYALCDVIENGNSFKLVAQTTTNADGTLTSLIPGPVTTEEKAQKKNDVKARSFRRLNKPDLDTMSFDDLYNNFKIFEQVVKGTTSSSSSSQNMAFVSSLSSTNEVNTAYGVSTTNAQVSPASTQVSTASTQVSTDNLSDDTVYAFLASQPNGSQLIYEDLEQIHEDDIEEMDLKWQLTLLSMRTRRFFQKTGRKITINGSDTAGYDKSKVECFNCHKIRHFVRECRGPRNQDSRNRNQDSSRRAINVEETSSKAMVAIDGAGFDWSYMVDDEVPTNIALMAFSDSKVHNNKTCSKTCLKSFETLKTQLDDLRIKFNKSEFNLATYKRGLTSIKEQLVFYKKNKVIFCEQLAVLKRDISYQDSEISMLKSELEKIKQEKESNQLKIEKFDNASKSLDKLIGRLFSPPNLDLSYSGLEEFQQPEFEGYGPKTSKSVIKDISNKVRETPNAPLVKELVSNDNLEKKTVSPTVAKIKSSTPMETSKPLMKDENAEDVDVHLYRSLIGSLMYLTSSRPDIMFVVCACARFQVTPKVSHLHAVKRIFRYLKGQPKLGLWYPKDSPFNLEAYTDSDYAGASLDRKSTIGGCQFLRSRLISWQCKKQTVVADSTTEAEYVAAASCCGQLMLLGIHLLLPVLVNVVRHKLTTVGSVNAVRYALTVNPTIYTSCIKQFWATAKAKTVNGEVQIQALVDGKKVIVTETSVRRALQLKDVEGTECLPNATIFAELERMGYENLTQKLTFYKAFFSPQWKFLSIQFCNALVLRLLLLDELRVELNFLCIQEPITDEATNEEHVLVHSNDPLLSVLDLENTKTSEDAMNTKLKEGVKKLERRNKSRTLGLKRLRKVGRSAQVVSSEDEEVTLVDEAQERNDDNLMFDTRVLDEQEVEVEKVVSTTKVTTAIATTTTVDELTLAQSLIEIKAAKPKAVTTAATTTTTTVTRPKARELMDKRKKHFAKLKAEEIRRKPLTKAQRNQMCTYLKNMANYKHSQLKNKSFEEIQMLFDNTIKRVDSFIHMDTEVVEGSKSQAEGSKKRTREELESDNSKKQKIDENEEVKVDVKHK
ncbi:ribonuclease H-like domain-containing protein [Tanacetum coccineum]